MTVLWRGRPSTVAEVREEIPAPLAYNTVLTILRNLEAKGFVKHEAEGRVFRYSPAITEEAVRGSAVTRLVRKFFGGSPLGMVAHLVENEALSASEIKHLQRLIDAHGAKAPKKNRREKP
jgi:predicted transcriptional regulator